MPYLLVRPPATSLADGIVTHLERKPVDYEKATEQWSQYVKTISEEGGFTPLHAPQSNTHPDSVFIEDKVLIVGPLAILCNSPSTSARHGEAPGVLTTLQSLPNLRLESLPPHCLVDGGDVLKIDKTVYIGLSGRTNQAAHDHIRDLITPLGYTLVSLPVTKTLHLKSQITALPDGTVIGYAPLVDDVGLFAKLGRKFVGVPEPEGAAVVCLGGRKVALSATAVGTKALLEGLRWEVVTVEIGEFEKLEGCPTCLSVRIRDV
ncbi:dimethylarginine dimethylaminohydrolase [Fimicolochytrium jonesii]|uniref:dimethylarginine dimethylaminohydrolase n=1 Tax=Fimicolochytrium jonesii TaxID=1396493 RepID=UPI0022FEB630|nr:dimethylarginine dimethylaminohydrolase [Fimicolochytrium jonesii]KAI8820863.1 dimethylarginine dimethylaminohydrolase [Fimicolochytrium jonesii]